MFGGFSRLEIWPAGAATAGPVRSFCVSPSVRGWTEVAIVAEYRLWDEVSGRIRQL